jgi:hypothetical protein
MLACARTRGGVEGSRRRRRVRGRPRRERAPGPEGRSSPREERSEEAIDAIAGPFAIEHTSVDTLKNQRRDSAWFMQAAGNLEAELRREGHAPACRLAITLEYDAIGKGQNFSAIRAALKSWIVNDAPGLPDGGSIENIAGVPFPVRVMKAAKLAKHQCTGATTILLVENDDLALMNDWTMLEAIREAFPNGPPSGVDRVWYADTAIPKNLEFKDFTLLAWGGEE